MVLGDDRHGLSSKFVGGCTTVSMTLFARYWIRIRVECHVSVCCNTVLWGGVGVPWVYIVGANHGFLRRVDFIRGPDSCVLG